MSVPLECYQLNHHVFETYSLAEVHWGLRDVVFQRQSCGLGTAAVM